MGYQIVTPFAVNKKNGDNNGYIKKDVIKMTVPKLENKENANSEIKRIETTHKPYKALRNRICGIGLILLGVASIAVQSGMETTNGTAAVMLLVMGLTAVFSKE